VALVTAAGSGMGRASAQRFAQEGAHVIVTDINEAAAQETVILIKKDGGSAEAHRVDVSSLVQLTELFALIHARHGVLHVLFNHAGVPGSAGLDIGEEDFDLAVNVNLKGAFFATACAHPLLKAADGKGSVIFTSSVSGIVGSPLSPLYSMTKGGVTTLMKSLALRLAPDGIRVNAICPSTIETPMLPRFFGGSGQPDDDATLERIENFTPSLPLGRRGRPDEVADAALFLACDESSYVTGVALPVDGGYLAK
jgi:NAD(P)-dependent dehydrogenase (short-subunit alcohol dehydrogenase family)